MMTAVTVSTVTLVKKGRTASSVHHGAKNVTFTLTTQERMS